MTDIPGGFRDVDAQEDPSDFSDYLARVAAQLSRHKSASMKLMRPSPGDRLVDVGCGTGHDVRELAKLVGVHGLAVGVDKSKAFIEDARHLGTSGKAPSFLVADAHDLPFSDNSFDGARTDRTLQHVIDPVAVLREMRRVVRPGGRLVVSEPDWGSLIIDTTMTAEEDRVRNELRDTRIRNGRIGRQIAGHLTRLGLRDISIHPVTLILRHFNEAADVMSLNGSIPSQLQTDLQARDDDHTFLAAITGFTVEAIVS